VACTACGFDNPASVKFCGSCGRRLAAGCSRTDAPLKALAFIAGLVATLVPAMGGPSTPAARVADGFGVVRSGGRGCRQVALTFDLCPVRRGSGFDAPLVDELRDGNVPATFFLSGRWIAAHESETKRLLAVPFFEVETHGQRHAHLAGLDRSTQLREIEGPVHLLRARYGRLSSFFRPPYGEYDATTLDVAHELGLRVVLWSVVSGDPDPRLSEAAILADVEDRLRDGDVVAFHANGRGWHTREVIRDLLIALAERRLHPVTVAELLHGCGGSR
jgi:peptidoglycan-N-acetylglucosamine deacetylase